MPVVVYDPDEWPAKVTQVPAEDGLDCSTCGGCRRVPTEIARVGYGTKKATDPRVAGEGTCSEPVSAVEQHGSSVGVVMRSNAIPPKQRKPTHRRAATKALTAGREVSGSLLARTLIDRAG